MHPEVDVDVRAAVRLLPPYIREGRERRIAVSRTQHNLDSRALCHTLATQHLARTQHWRRRLILQLSLLAASVRQRCIDLDQKHLSLPAWLQKRQQPHIRYLHPLVCDMEERRKERELYR